MPRNNNDGVQVPRYGYQVTTSSTEYQPSNVEGRSAFDWIIDEPTTIKWDDEYEEVSIEESGTEKDYSYHSFYDGIKINERDATKFDFVIPTKDSGLYNKHFSQAKNSFGFIFSNKEYVFLQNGITEHIKLKNCISVIPTQEMFDVLLKKFLILIEISSLTEIVNKGLEYGLDVCLKCKSCGQIHTTYNYIMLGIDGQYYCRDCYNKLFTQCKHCGSMFERSFVNEENLCAFCSKRHYILAYHDWRRPKVKFYGGKDDGRRLFLGVESEVDIGGESNRHATELMKIMNDNDNFTYCMHDGSLASGFEIITQPATLRHHISMAEKYKKGFKYLIDKDYLSHDTSTCGLHVHFNRSFYQDNEELYISRLLLLNEKFWDKLVIFSRRNHRKLEQYAKKVDMDVKDYIRRTNKSCDHDYHYYSVNLANNNTIEFRMFRGTLNVNTYIATLQLCQNMIKCAKTRTAEDIQRMEFEELITHPICKKYWNSLKSKVGTEE